MGVYAVPQVVAAAFPVSEISGEIATTVKLGRVLMLGPVLLAIGLIAGRRGVRRESGTLGWSTILPWFVVGFLAMAVLRLLGLLPEGVAQPARMVGTWMTVLAMAGLGLGVRLSAVRVVGPRVAAAVVTSLAVLLGLTLLLIRVLGVGV
jgi:uncharacterized membrane protein YadS